MGGQTAGVAGSSSNRPKKYRPKTLFMTVFTGTPNPNHISEVFFVDPGKARPTLMDFQDLPSKPYGDELLRTLGESKINKAAWDGLDKRNRATILNLSAKMFRESTRNGQPVIKQVKNIDKKLLDKKNRARIYSNTNDTLLGALRKFPERFKGTSGVDNQARHAVFGILLGASATALGENSLLAQGPRCKSPAIERTEIHSPGGRTSL
jgi:hypothetical protein